MHVILVPKMVEEEFNQIKVSFDEKVLDDFSFLVIDDDLYLVALDLINSGKMDDLLSKNPAALLHALKLRKNAIGEKNEKN